MTTLNEMFLCKYDSLVKYLTADQMLYLEQICLNWWLVSHCFMLLDDVFKIILNI